MNGLRGVTLVMGNGQAVELPISDAETTRQILSSIAEIRRELASIRQSLDCRAENAVQTMPSKEWYSVRDVAERTRYSAYTIRQACNTGRIPSEHRKKIENDEWRISASGLETIQNEGLPKVRIAR